MYDRDITTEIDLEGATALATFSTYLNDCHPEDLPTLTLETVQLGDLHLNREQVIAWVGKTEVARLETDCTPETWEAQDHRDYEGESA